MAAKEPVPRLRAQVDLDIISDQYGFGRSWALTVKTAHGRKYFYLGQDAKVCQRTLGMSPQDLDEAVTGKRRGVMDMTDPRTRQKLARYLLRWILNMLRERGIRNVYAYLMTLQPWELHA